MLVLGFPDRVLFCFFGVICLWVSLFGGFPMFSYGFPSVFLRFSFPGFLYFLMVFVMFGLAIYLPKVFFVF